MFGNMFWIIFCCYQKSRTFENDLKCIKNSLKVWKVIGDCCFNKKACIKAIKHVFSKKEKSNKTWLSKRKYA